MKYKTLEYNMNYPFLKQVTEPLDSVYGLAIRVVKNGQVMPLPGQGDIVVDGQDGVGTRGTWQLFELSSGSQPQTKLLSVDAYVPKDPIHYSMVGTQTLTNQQPFPLGTYADFKLSAAGLSDSTQLYASSTKLSAWFAGQQITSYTDIEVSPEGKTALSDMYCLNTDTNLWENVQLTAETIDSIFATDGGFIRVRGTVPASGTAEVRAVFDTDVDNGTEQVSFKLQVQEQDLNYIEI